MLKDYVIENLEEVKQKIKECENKPYKTGLFFVKENVENSRLHRKLLAKEEVLEDILNKIIEQESINEEQI